MYKSGQTKRIPATKVKMIPPMTKIKRRPAKNLNEIGETRADTGEVGFIDSEWDSYDGVPIPKELLYTESNIPDEWNLKK